MEGEGGSEEAKAVDQLQPELPPSSEEQEEKKEDNKYSYENRRGKKITPQQTLSFPSQC